MNKYFTLNAERLKKWYFFALLGIYILYVLDPIQIPMWPYGHSIVIRCVPLLMIIYLCSTVKRSNSIEAKLLLTFLLWLFITRILNINNDSGKITDYWWVSTVMVCCLFMGLCGIFDKQARQKVLDCFAVITSAVYSVFAIIGIYTAVLRTTLINPLSPDTFISRFTANYLRLFMFGRNCNTCAFWFFVGFFASVYLFFRGKNSSVKILSVISALLNYTALAVTYSRNGMISFSVCFSLVCILVVLNRLNFKKSIYKVLVTICLLLVLLPAWYGSFSCTTSIIGGISNSISQKESPAINSMDLDTSHDITDYSPGTVDSTAAAEDVDFTDRRGFDDSGRIEIWRSAFYTMKTAPIRLLIGCHFDAKMVIASTVLSSYLDNFHNMFLDLTNITGLPGLFMVLVLLAVLGYKGAKLFFAEKESVDMATKVAIIPLCGILSYNMLETALLFDASRSIVFFLLSGLVIVTYKEVCGSVSVRKA